MNVRMIFVIMVIVLIFWVVICVIVNLDGFFCYVIKILMSVRIIFVSLI